MAGEVWVWAEQYQGNLMDVSAELLGKARELANSLGTGLASILLGENVEDLAPELIGYGADKVYVLQVPGDYICESNFCASALADLASKYEPQILILGATGLGREISCSAAARLNTGLTAHCVDLYVNEEARLIQVVPWIEDNTLMEIICSVNPQMATVKPGIFLKPAKDETRTGEVVKVDQAAGGGGSGIRILEVFEEDVSEVPLERADVVVSGGWGLHSAGGFEPVRELAQVLGGAVGGTRPAVDEGWIPETLMIGQSGKTVSPKLFVSVGASGAMHYTTGFSRAGVILAIDRNPESPIFEVADVGIVGDIQDILPCLIKEIKRARQ